MKKFIKMYLVGMMVAMMMVIGCDNGSSSDDPKETPPESSYMTLNSVDGDDVIEAAVDSGFCQETSVVAKALSIVDSNDSVKAVEALSNSLMGMGAEIAVNRQIHPEDSIDDNVDIIPGSCGGTVTIVEDLTTIEAITAFDFTADQFCDEEMSAEYGVMAKVEINGSGKYVIDNTEKDAVTLSLTLINVSVKVVTDVFEDEIDMVINCDITMVTQYNGGEGEVTTLTITNLNIVDNIENETLNLKGTVIHSLEYEEFTSITTVDLTFENADGKVDVTTPVSIFTYNEGMAAVEGELLITGANDTKMLIMISDTNTFKVMVDTNGDGVYDHYAGCVMCGAV